MAGDLQLSSLHVDADVDERRNSFGGHAFVSNQHVYLVDWSDQRSTNRSDLSMIGDNDLLSCLTHHGSMYRGLVRIVCSDAMFDVNAIDAAEYLVDKDPADAFDSAWSNEREPVSTQKSPRNDDLQISAMTQLHRHVHGI